MSKIISDQIEKSRTLTEGLKKKIMDIRNKGIDEKFINDLESDTRELELSNQELDKLKVEMRRKSIDVNRRLTDIKNRMKDAKKIIKGDYEQYQWKDFGVTDKR